MAYLNEATKQIMQQLRLKGGVEAVTLSGARTLNAKDANILFLNPDGANRNITLPAEETSDGLFFIIKSEAATAFNLVILDDAGSTIVTINQDEWAIVACDGTTWRDVPLSALSDYLATANAWTAAQTFQNVLFGAASELTIASGAIAATRSYHTVDTEADAASDDLDDITGLAAGEILFVTPAHTDRSIVLRHAVGANKIATLGGRNITLAETTDWALLMGNGTQATVIAASTLVDGLLGADNAWTGAQTFRNLIVAAGNELTIASGAVAATRSHHTVDTEGDAASDDLDDITGLGAGELLLLTAAHTDRSVVLRHAIGANKIATLGARNITLAEVTDWVLLVGNGTQATVIACSTLADGILAASNTWTGPQAFQAAITTTDGVVGGTARAVGGRAAVITAAGTSHTASTDEAVLASYSIPANTIKAGTVVKCRFHARVTADNGGTTLTGRLRIGATTLTGTELIASSAVDTSSGHVFIGEFTLIGRAAPGAAAAVVGVGSFQQPGAAGGALVTAKLDTTNFATNGALLLELTADWSAADANAVQAEIFVVEVIG
jgi:hypothetical protein